MSDANFVISEAEKEDLPSIGTLHVRAFHPSPANKWHRDVFKDTPANSKWWQERYASDIDDQRCLLLKAASPKIANEVIGLLCMRKIAAGESGAGKWTSFPHMPDTDPDEYDTMVASMLEYRQKVMGDKAFFLLEHFGIDARYQGTGLGTRVIRRAMETADEARLEVYVQANEFAAGFYTRCGFESVGRVKMPGGMDECFLVRRLNV